ncbi:11652_t:CDS:1, partial [Dentiscutata erythropus]
DLVLACTLEGVAVLSSKPLVALFEFITSREMLDRSLVLLQLVVDAKNTS